MNQSPVWNEGALATFANLYPERSGTFHHALENHPLLTLASLAELAERMTPDQIEYNRADLPLGVDPLDPTLANGLTIGDTIRGIDHNGSWAVLKFIERDPVYAALLDHLLAPLRPVVEPLTGPMLKREAFLFISSPNAVTPFHFDPEHNILLQLKGTKTMTVFPADDERVAAGAEHERFHLGGHRNLPWREDLARFGTANLLAPGDAIFVPVMSPHWVKVGHVASLSLSITWRSEWSFREAEVRGMNALLRRFGVDPAPPRRWPGRNRGKSLAYRVLRRVGAV